MIQSTLTRRDNPEEGNGVYCRDRDIILGYTYNYFRHSSTDVYCTLRRCRKRVYVYIYIYACVYIYIHMCVCTNVYIKIEYAELRESSIPLYTIYICRWNCIGLTLKIYPRLYPR